MGFVVKLVLILAVAVGGVWVWTVFMPKQAQAPVVQQEEVKPLEQKPQTPAELISASGSADAALEADLRALDAQLESAQTESAAVEQSFSDKPVEQTE
jgi:hypothetical protein